MANTFKCTIATPEGSVFDEMVERVTLETEMGEITILANHEPFVGLAREGEVEIEQGGKVRKFSLGAGVVEVEKRGDLVLLLKRASEETSE